MEMKPLSRLPEIEKAVCELVAQRLGWAIHQVMPSTPLATLPFDSLDFMEVIQAIEQRFAITLEFPPTGGVCKVVFTRDPFRLSDFAEMAYLAQGSTPVRKPSFWSRQPKSHVHAEAAIPFTQLSGIWEARLGDTLLEELPEIPHKQYRRRSDGMRCIWVPPARVEIGCDEAIGLADESPCHTVGMDGFLMDAEPVSTTAYCRFLNSTAPVQEQFLAEWFVLEEADHRKDQMLLVRTDTGWQPRPGTERWPMVLVSWFGANAYSLWANGQPWWRFAMNGEADANCFLPSEAQWEYAARGARYRRYPWGDAEATPDKGQFSQHAPGNTYAADALPMAAVNERLGMSPFGLHHMAGNIWQWCRDWYDPGFYERGDAALPNPVNRWPSGIRSERGGSWVGPASLSRSSYRRGRAPHLRGRCLGFRCVSAQP